MSGGTFVWVQQRQSGRDPDDEHQRTVHAHLDSQCWSDATTLYSGHQTQPFSWQAPIETHRRYGGDSHFCNQMSSHSSTILCRDQIHLPQVPIWVKIIFRLPTEASGWQTSHHDIPPHQEQTDWTTVPTSPQRARLQGSWKCLGDVLGFIHSLPSNSDSTPQIPLHGTRY